MPLRPRKLRSGEHSPKISGNGPVVVAVVFGCCTCSELPAPSRSPHASIDRRQRPNVDFMHSHTFGARTCSASKVRGVELRLFTRKIVYSTAARSWTRNPSATRTAHQFVVDTSSAGGVDRRSPGSLPAKRSRFRSLPILRDNRFSNGADQRCKPALSLPGFDIFESRLRA